MSVRDSEVSEKRRSSRFRRQSEWTLHNFMAGSHAALTSANMTGSRFAIQFDTEEGQEIERKIFRRKLPKGKEEPIDFEDALEETGFRTFHIFLYLTCGIIYMACSASLSTLSFTLPASNCALNLTSSDKGQINVFPYLGMFFGTFFWGSISDTKGRRTALILSLFLDTLAGVLSSFSINKYMLMTFRIFNGFSIIGATSLVFAYYGEFLTQAQGEIWLPLIEFFYCFGMIYIPALAWLIVPFDFTIPMGELKYESWNLFTACASIPSLTGLILITFFPESPKFTFLTGKLEVTYATLQKMYSMNTRQPERTYPVKCLMNSEAARNLKKNQISYHAMIRQQFVDLFNSYKVLFGQEFMLKSMLCCFIDFFFNFGYLTMIIWVPEMLERMEKYQHEFGEFTSMCEASEKISKAPTPEGECTGISQGIYIHGLIITSSSIPVVITAFLLLQFFSKKIILCGLLSITGIASFLFVHMKNEIVMIFLCALFESSATLLETLLFIIIVEMFPTTIAGTALAATACSGRLAAVIGNVFMGEFVDSKCSIPMYTFGTCFFGRPGSSQPPLSPLRNINKF